MYLLGSFFQHPYNIQMGAEEETKEKPDFKDVENGPMDQSNRQCRDIFCCILFFANICAMIYVTIYGYLNGNPDKIFRGIAGDGTICGQPGEVAAQFPYVYLYQPIASLNNRVCVKTCPTFNNTVLSNLECYSGHTVSCNYDVVLDQSGSPGSYNLSSPSINFIGYSTSSTLGRVCMPSAAILNDAFSSILEALTTQIQSGQFASITQDVSNNWQWLLVGVGFSVVISLVFMFLLRCLVGCIVWVSCIGSILFFVALGVIFLYNGGTISSDYVGFLGLPTLSTSTSTDYYNTYGYIAFGVAGVLLILLLCCCNRLRLAVAVCKVAGQFVIRVCQSTLVPIFIAIILIGMWAACLVVMVYLLSATTFAARQSNGMYDMLTSVNDYADSNLLQLYYFIFATLWCNAILQALSIFIIASACCMWYYNHGANSELDSPIFRSVKMAFRYHFGSLAFGSFILAVVQFLQLLVQAFKKQAENTGADQSKCFQYAINCLRCCLACVERIVQFINKTAYIQIALRGKNFCMAAKDGFEIVWSNGIRYLIVAGVGSIMMFIGKIMIATGATAAFYALITFETSIKSGIIEPIYLLLIVFIISYAIGTLFMAVYAIAIDTLLACFIVDEMNQQASGGKKALHGPEQLYELMPTD